MKKTLLFISLFFLINTGINLYAQEFGPTWRFGFKGGPNFTKIGTKDFNSKIGFQLGAVVDLRLSEYIFLRSGIDLINKGGVYKKNLEKIGWDRPNEGSPFEAYLTGKSKTTTSLTYLQVPFMVGYRVEIDDDMSITYSIGGYAAGGIGGSLKTNVKGRVEQGGVTVNIDKDYKESGYPSTLKKKDFGLMGGIGIELPHLFFTFEYEHGLTNLSSGPITYISRIETKRNNWKNRTFMLSAGYRF